MAEGSKLLSMQDAVARHVRDGDVVVIEGFTHLISFAAGHEIIRQRRRDLTLCRLTPDLIYDQMIAAGCAKKLVFSWAGNPGVGSLHAFRRAVEGQTLEIEEYSHFGMVARFSAGAARLPFWTLRDYVGTDLPRANPRIRSVTSSRGARIRRTHRATTTATTISTSAGRRSPATAPSSRATWTNSSTACAIARSTCRSSRGWWSG